MFISVGSVKWETGDVSLFHDSLINSKRLASVLVVFLYN